MQYLVQLSLFLLAGSTTTLADLIRVAPRSAIPELTSLTRRQFCPFSLEICSSFNGESVCQEADEVCCQLIDGSNPFTCPLDHPYCCPPSSDGTLLCGSNALCTGPVNDAPSATVLPTASTGSSVQASAGGSGQTASVASAQTSGGSGKTATATAATATATGNSGGQTATVTAAPAATTTAKGGAGRVKRAGWGVGGVLVAAAALL